MSPLAPTLQAFFTDRLLQQRHASPHTIAAYRDTWKLLVRFAAAHLAKAPSQLELGDLDAPLVGRFLVHLEHDRANSVRTRNARLSAIHALFRYAVLDHPEQAAVIARVLAIPLKCRPRRLVTFLSDVEVDALLAAPDRTTWTGRRDHTLFALAVQTGPARLRAHRPALCRSAPRAGCTRQLPGEGAQAADYAPHQAGGRRPADMAQRTCRHTKRTSLSYADGPISQPGCTGAALGDTRGHRHARLPLSPREERHPAYATPHRRHAVAARRGRHRCYRSVARTRTPRHDRHLHPCGPRPERTRARQDDTRRCPGRPLSAIRCPPGFPRRAVIMPIVSAQASRVAGAPAPTSA